MVASDGERVTLSLDVSKYFQHNATSMATSTSVDYGVWLSQDVIWGSYDRSESPAHTPESYLDQKQKRIAKKQIDERNNRIKQWDDKRKRFK